MFTMKARRMVLHDQMVSFFRAERGKTKTNKVLVLGSDPGFAKMKEGTRMPRTIPMIALCLMLVLAACGQAAPQTPAAATSAPAAAATGAPATVAAPSGQISFMVF